MVELENRTGRRCGLLLGVSDVPSFALQERQDSVRISLIKFALCFLMVGTGDTISTFLETKGNHNVWLLCA